MKFSKYIGLILYLLSVSSIACFGQDKTYLDLNQSESCESNKDNGTGLSFEPPKLKACGKILFVLDISKSMDKKFFEKTSRLEESKQLILSLLKKIHPSRELGLRLIGKFEESGYELKNSELIVPISSNSKNQIESNIRQVSTQGQNSHLTWTIGEIIESDLKNIQNATAVILITRELIDSRALADVLRRHMNGSKRIPKFVILAFGDRLNAKTPIVSSPQLERLKSRSSNNGHRLRDFALCVGGDYYSESEIMTFFESISSATKEKKEDSGKAPSSQSSQ